MLLKHNPRILCEMDQTIIEHINNNLIIISYIERMKEVKSTYPLRVL